MCDEDPDIGATSERGGAHCAKTPVEFSSLKISNDAKLTKNVRHSLEDTSSVFAKLCSYVLCLFAGRSIELSRKKSGWLD